MSPYPPPPLLSPETSPVIEYLQSEGGVSSYRISACAYVDIIDITIRDCSWKIGDNNVEN